MNSLILILILILFMKNSYQMKIFNMCLFYFFFLMNWNMKFFNNIFLLENNFSFLLINLSLWVFLILYWVNFSFFFNFNFNKLIFWLFNFNLLFLLLFFFSKMLLFFYIFFELNTLIPLVTLLMLSYSFERFQAILYMLFFTLFFSLFFLMFILKNYWYNLLFLQFFFLKKKIEEMMSCMLMFLVKLPFFSIHFWLSKAHVEAIFSSSIYLAAILLKLGGYGMIIFMKFFIMKYLLNMFIWFLIFCIIMNLYPVIICFRQFNIKMLIAYSSIAHMMMGLIMFLLLNFFSKKFNLIMFISHAFISSWMFYFAGLISKMNNSYSVLIWKNIFFYSYMFWLFWSIMSLINMGIPFFLNFLGEMIFLMNMKFFFSFFLILLIIMIFLLAMFNIYLMMILFSNNLLIKNMMILNNQQIFLMYFFFLNLFSLFFKLNLFYYQ